MRIRIMEIHCIVFCNRCVIEHNEALLRYTREAGGRGLLLSQENQEMLPKREHSLSQFIPGDK